MSPEEFLKTVRNRWAIKNNLHWVPDVRMGEDAPSGGIRKRLDGAMSKPWKKGHPHGEDWHDRGRSWQEGFQLRGVREDGSVVFRKKERCRDPAAARQTGGVGNVDEE